jgi:hypothetical protein
MNFKIKIEWHLSTSDKETISEFEVTDFQTGDLLILDLTATQFLIIQGKKLKGKWHYCQ